MVRTACPHLKRAAVVLLFLAAAPIDAKSQQGIAETDLILDGLPDSVRSTMEVRDRFFAQLQPGLGGEEFLVAELRRWQPGQTVRVAFLGGNPTLNAEIAEATAPITEACNLTLDFGEDAAGGTFRTWSTTDAQYAAEIRVSFDQAGFFSLVGTDSIAPNIGTPFGAVGGRPNQRSLNFGGFDVQRPSNWMGVVRHEFLHALAFHHEHQSLASPCEEEFRWEDDPGYVPTQDGFGRFVSDSAGRRPGIYTYLAGFPNFWSRQRVDFNLRRFSPSDDVTFGDFDRESVMLYRFPPLFYRNSPSPCTPLGDGIALSSGDVEGLLLLYPEDEAEVRRLAASKARALEIATDPDIGSESYREAINVQRNLLRGP